ncbi:MAG TPA: response regulator [Elusimicrobiales bacterium]|nr:response regulator [Elusimicrobiales bacterium]
MFNTIQVICASEKNRLLLRGLFKNLGADAVFSLDLNDALAIFEKARPAAVFVVDGEEPPVEIQLREIKRVAPFIPVVPLLKRRDATRAVELMKAGAFDCAQSPWTEEALRPLYKRSLNISGTALELDSTGLRARRRALAVLLAAACALTGFSGGLYYGFRKYFVRPAVQESFALPYSHPTGIVVKKDSVLISDWHTQAIYEHDILDFKILKVVSLPETTPVAMAAGQDSFWLAGTDGVIEKRLPDARYTTVSKSAPLAPIADGACFDGLYFWTADSRSGRIVKRLPADALAELKTFAYPGEKLGAFACDARFLWAVDPVLKALVKMSLDDPERIISRTGLAAYASKTLTISALAAREGKIWFTGEDKGRGFVFYKDEPK